LGEHFAERGGALHVGADDLMGPPLVRHFVGDDVVDHVDIVRLFHFGDEADGLRIGHGAGEGLGKAGYAGELDDAGLFVGVGAEVLGEVVQ